MSGLFRIVTSAHRRISDGATNIRAAFRISDHVDPYWVMRAYDIDTLILFRRGTSRSDPPQRFFDSYP